MTVEDEKGYEIAKEYLRKKYGDDYVDFLETEGQSYLDGLAKGKLKWHDLRKDPDDLPPLDSMYSMYWTYSEWGYYDIHKWDPRLWKECKVIAWCELPKFDVE